MRPVTLPSLSAARVSVCTWSRPWWADIRLSLRVSVYFTGLPSRRATAQAIHSSGVVWSLPPKPPPTSGAMTRIFDSGTPVVAARANRRMCGIWVADHMVICSPVGSTTTLRGSMNAGISRCWRYSRSIRMPSVRAVPIASSTSPPVPASCGVEDPQRGLVGAEVGVGEDRVLGGLLEVEHGGQLVVLDVDELGGVARLGGAAGHHHRDDLAGEGDPVGRHRRVRRRLLVGRDRPGVDADAELVAEVLAGQHGDHVGRGLGRLDVDASDRRVGEGAAHHRQVQHPGERDVVGPPGAAGDQPLVLLAAPVLADLGGVGGRSWVAVMPCTLAAGACSAAYSTALTMLW